MENQTESTKPPMREQIAERLYEAYRKQKPVAVNGTFVPEWASLKSNPERADVVAAWLATADEASRLIGTFVESTCTLLGQGLAAVGAPEGVLQEVVLATPIKVEKVLNPDPGFWVEARNERARRVEARNATEGRGA